MTEYWLQKRTLTMWSHVTYYMTLEEAQSNLERVKGNGYSWRIMKCEVVEECLNEGEREIEQEIRHESEYEQIIDDKLTGEFKSTWGGQGASGWGKPMTNGPIKDTGHHGLTGSVWMVHFGLKKKTRIRGDQEAEYVGLGYVRGSPRTVL